MMFLLRLAFWITFICLLLPGSKEDSARLMSSAEKTVDDVKGFCGRNPEVCANARLAVTSVLSKVKTATEIVGSWIGTPGNKDQDRVSTPAPAPSGSNLHDGGYAAPAPATQWRNSLNPADRQVPWRGPQGL